VKSNKAVAYSAKTHEGGRADAHQTPLKELERAVSTCLLFENTFYEKGSEIAARIEALCTTVPVNDIAAMAVRARTQLKLRHVPLFLCVQLLKRKAGPIAGATILDVVKRPDEMGELIALYRKNGRIPLAAQLKKGLAKVFPKWSAHALAKWNGDAAVKLRDVLFMVHPKPKDAEQEATWKKLVDGTLESADTWEVALSSGASKLDTWVRLLQEKKLGYMALLMNLRNMEQAGVPYQLVADALTSGAKGSMALPFRFVSAVKHAPSYAEPLSEAMEAAIEGELPGDTAIVIDVSGSMNAPLSGRGTLQRYEAAAALAVLARGIVKGRCRIFTYDTSCREVAAHKGLGLVTEIQKHIGGGTNTEAALKFVQKACPAFTRVILLTDEQAHDGIHQAWTKYAYLINVAPYQPGLEAAAKGWTRINGFSERLIDWMRYEETTNQEAHHGDGE
jgi:60 kDa SS-A/Ro ribonucleoprotein